MNNFQLYCFNAYSWSLKTFGPGERDVGITDHIRKELREIETALNKFEKIEEWIDVFILVNDALLRHGLDPSEILLLADAKCLKNKYRNWPDWRSAEHDKAIEHIR